MASAWHREDQPDLAAEKILDAAERAFVEIGVSAASMARIAEYACCSRGTLYRYFPTRHDLHLAYVNRTARRIVSRVRKSIEDIDDPRKKLVEGILRSVREARRSPGAAAWFEPTASGIAARMSRTSEVVDALTTTFVSELLSAGQLAGSQRLAARWLVRVIVSLLAVPGESAAEERTLIDRFVAPALLPSDS